MTLSNRIFTIVLLILMQLDSHAQALDQRLFRELVGDWNVNLREWIDGYDSTRYVGKVKARMLRDTIRTYRDSSGVEFRLIWPSQGETETIDLDRLKFTYSSSLEKYAVSFLHGWQLNSSRAEFCSAKELVDHKIFEFNDSPNEPHPTISYCRWTFDGKKMVFIQHLKMGVSSALKKRVFIFER